jgi:peroxiredoxin
VSEHLKNNWSDSMEIKKGDKMPPGVFGVMTESGPGAISSDELFSGKKVVLISVPGAFTPTCSAKHLPGFLQHAEALSDKGVDTIAFIAVNDVHVMHAWGQDQGVGEKISMLADGNGEYTEALDLVLDGRPFGMGMRGKRFAIVADDGVATHVAVEGPGQFEVSDAESVLANL